MAAVNGAAVMNTTLNFIKGEWAMKSSVISLFLFSFLIIPGSIFATEPDPADAVLIAYELTEQQETDFNNKDGSLSGFWSAWDRDNAGKLDLVKEMPSTHGSGIKPAGPEDVCYGQCGCTYPGFSDGEDDAQLHVKAAYGTNGIYLLIEAVDDLFVGLVATGAGYQDMSENIATETSAYKAAHLWMNDCFDMCLDIYSAEDLTTHYIPNTYDYLTYSTYQYQFRFGSDQPASTIRINYVDPTWKECVGSNCWSIIFGNFSMAEAEEKYKVKIETVNIGEHSKAQEWLIPWSSYAAGVSKPAVGAKLAITLQYNDIDAMDGEGADLNALNCLFFKNKQSVFAHREPNAACGTSTPWGNVEFGGKLNDLVPPEGGVAATPKMLASVKENVKAQAYFTLSGRKLANQKAMITGKEILIKKSVLNSGYAVCEKSLIK
jgi:hypothetical protein